VPFIASHNAKPRKYNHELPPNARHNPLATSAARSKSGLCLALGERGAGISYRFTRSRGFSFYFYRCGVGGQILALPSLKCRPTTQCSRPVEPGFIAQGLVSPDGISRAADWERWAVRRKAGQKKAKASGRVLGF
jgi:hypothetical protein